MSDPAFCPDCRSDYLVQIDLDAIGMAVLSKKLEAFQCQNCAAIVFNMLSDKDDGSNQPDHSDNENPRSL